MNSLASKANEQAASLEETTIALERNYKYYKK